MPDPHSPHFRQHGGNLFAAAQAKGISLDRLLDFSASLNPAGEPDFVQEAFLASALDRGRYPDPEYRRLRELAAASIGIGMEQLVFGNGEDELIFAAVRCLVHSTLLVLEPSYGSYREAAGQAGLALRCLRLRAEDGFIPHGNELAAALAELPKWSGVCIASPNNPTAVLPGRELLLGLIRRYPQVTFLIDEAFIDLCVNGVDQSLVGSVTAWPDNLVVLRSLTKTYAIPGLRLGYAIAPAGKALAIRSSLQSWPLNCVADRVGQAIFSFGGEWAALSRPLVKSGIDQLREALAEIPGLRVFPSLCNFLLLELSAGRSDGKSLPDFLAEQGIIVRPCAVMPGLDERYIRVAVRTKDENEELIAGIRSWNDQNRFIGADGLITSKYPIRPKKLGAQNKTPALMIQGCSSSTGKSLLAAAFCRIFREDGYAVNPFKAQNMSLNARVTIDGGEIGVAQFIQAQAAGREPDVRMNPVLLKPHSKSGTKIIVLGKQWGEADALSYGGVTEQLSKIAFNAYDELAAGTDIMILEGAGSPAEINLRHRDFVNMRAAVHADARVLLAGDIDRGGVFANFIGHVSTFRPNERRLLSGFIVNKFRGNPALLGNAYEQIRRITGFPVLGTVPYIADLAIDEEDGVKEPMVKPEAPLRVAIVRLEHMANAPDFDPLSAEPDLSVEFIRTSQELSGGNWDAIILPGSRSTVADLETLRRNGLAELIGAAAKRGTPIIGICGGLQMLGQRILDINAVETAQSYSQGLGLLALDTEFHDAKTLSRTIACQLASGQEVTGYEIHHGQSSAVGGATVVDMVRSDNSPVAWRQGAVWGTYLHGIFESDAFRSEMVNGWRKRRGLTEQAIYAWVGIEHELQRLSDIVRQSCDLGSIYRELGLRD